MKKIKEFIKENKVLIIGVGVAVVGGLVVYKRTKVNIAARVKHIEEDAEILRVLNTEPLSLEKVDALFNILDQIENHHALMQNIPKNA